MESNFRRRFNNFPASALPHAPHIPIFIHSDSEVAISVSQLSSKSAVHGELQFIIAALLDKVRERKWVGIQHVQ